MNDSFNRIFNTILAGSVDTSGSSVPTFNANQLQGVNIDPFLFAASKNDVLTYDSTGRLVEKESTLPAWWSLKEKEMMGRVYNLNSKKVQKQLNKLQNGFFFKILTEESSEEEKVYTISFNKRY